jgi:hypothetical protein
MNKYLPYFLFIIIFLIHPCTLFAKKLPLTERDPMEMKSWAAEWYEDVFDPTFSKEIYLMYIDTYNRQNTSIGKLGNGSSDISNYAGTPIGTQEQLNQSAYIAGYIKRRVLDKQAKNIAKGQPIIQQTYKIKEKLGLAGFSLSTGEAEKKTEMKVKYDVVKGYLNVFVNSYIANASLNYNMNTNLLFLSINKVITNTMSSSVNYIPKNKDINLTIGKIFRINGVVLSFNTVLNQKLLPGGNTGIYETLSFSM